jgi:hypothetical protein
MFYHLVELKDIISVLSPILFKGYISHKVYAKLSKVSFWGKV